MDGSYHIDTALRGYTDRILNLHKERDDLNGDIREIYHEAKEAGFDVTTVREMVRELRMEPEARNARYQLLNEYRQSLGLLRDTPLGDAAMRRAEGEAEAAPKRGRGRPRKDRAGEALEQARTHLGDASVDDMGEPLGAA
jgi:uncharacterized protein (UPF0335 family)